MTDYALATIKEWNLTSFKKHRTSLAGNWHLFMDPQDLTVERIRSISPRYLFFPHWSWKVPSELFNQSESILFHMTDLPYGRGGSPLQNLIASGKTTTMISAVKMEETLDTGPIYLKRPLDLSGSATEIFQNASDIIFEMIAEIIQTEPVPEPQEGIPTLFKRRTPQMSACLETGSLSDFYDHIRMLDAPDYPHAFLDHGEFRIELTNAEYRQGNIKARAVVTKKEKSR